MRSAVAREDVPVRNHAKQPRVRDTIDGLSDMSQSDDGKSLDSQDLGSNQDEDSDLRSLNSNELARTFDNEVGLFILTRCKITSYI